MLSDSPGPGKAYHRQGLDMATLSHCSESQPPTRQLMDRSTVHFLTKVATG